jgi:hypothetical protein
MATLTRHTTFKRLKENSSVKVKKVSNNIKKAQAEMEVFLQLLSKIKIKKV